MKNITVHKPNQLIEIVGNPISLQGLMAYNFLLHKFQQQQVDKFTISLSEIYNSLNVSNNYSELASYLESLQQIRVESRDEKGKVWGSFNLLAEFKKVEGGFFVQIPDTIYKALCGKPKEKDLYYTTIQLLEQRIFRCSYAIIFYEIFKKYEKVNIPTFTLEEIREFTETTDKYKVLADFKKRVLIPSLNEINQLDQKYKYTYEEKKLGRKVKEIKFIRELKACVNSEIIEIVDSLSEKKTIKNTDKIEVIKESELETKRKAYSVFIGKSNLSQSEKLKLLIELSTIKDMKALENFIRKYKKIK